MEVIKPVLGCCISIFESIDGNDISTLEKIAERGAPVLANRTASLTKQMFAYAVQKGLRPDNPCVVIPTGGGKGVIT